MASRAAGPSLRRAIHSSSSRHAPKVAPKFREKNPYGEYQEAGGALLPTSAKPEAKIDLSELPTFAKDKLKESDVGKAMVYSNTFAKQILEDASIPRTYRRDLDLLPRPTTVLRKATVALVEELKNNKNLKAILDGRVGSGRSTMLLQTIASCQTLDWPVLYVADAHELTDSIHPFILPKGDEKMYKQPKVAQILLQRFLSSNSQSALAKLDQAILKAVERGSKDVSSASEALEKLLASATQTSPILLAIDCAEALYTQSKYLNVDAKPIHPSLLSVPALLQQCLTGKGPFASLCTIAAVDKTSSIPALQRRQQKEGQDSSAQVQSRSPGPLTRTEAAGIYQHMADTLLLEHEPTDTTFIENLVSSDGNALLFTRGLLAIPGTPARGSIKKGKRRGTPVRADKLHSITVKVDAPQLDARV